MELGGGRESYPKDQEIQAEEGLVRGSVSQQRRSMLWRVCWQLFRGRNQ